MELTTDPAADVYFIAKTSTQLNSYLIVSLYLEGNGNEGTFISLKVMLTNLSLGKITSYKRGRKLHIFTLKFNHFNMFSVTIYSQTWWGVIIKEIVVKEKSN